MVDDWLSHPLVDVWGWQRVNVHPSALKFVPAARRPTGLFTVSESLLLVHWFQMWHFHTSWLSSAGCDELWSWSRFEGIDSWTRVPLVPRCFWSLRPDFGTPGCQRSMVRPWGGNYHGSGHGGLKSGYLQIHVFFWSSINKETITVVESIFVPGHALLNLGLKAFVCGSSTLTPANGSCWFSRYSASCFGDPGRHRSSCSGENPTSYTCPSQGCLVGFYIPFSIDISRYL